MEIPGHILRRLTRKLSLRLTFGLALYASVAAASIGSLGRDCGAGKTDACDQLVSIARNSGDGSLRRAAAEWLIKGRSRGCPSRAAEPPTWRQGQRIHITSEYLFENELNAGRQAEIVKAGDQFAASALRSLGLDPAEDQYPAQAVVRITVLGAARAWLFGRLALDGSQERPDDSVAILLYPDVAWKGVVTVRIAGRCVCADVLQSVAPRRDTLYGSPRRKESDAPFRRDLEGSLAPAMIHLGKDLYGTAAIARMAKSADAVKVRETALAQLRDQAAIAEIAKRDSDEHLRWAAVCKLTSQATLADAAQSDPSRIVRLSAVQKLANAAVLSGIAGNDNDPDVRRQARLRLEKLGKRR